MWGKCLTKTVEWHNDRLRNLKFRSIGNSFESEILSAYSKILLHACTRLKALAYIYHESQKKKPSVLSKQHFPWGKTAPRNPIWHKEGKNYNFFFKNCSYALSILYLMIKQTCKLSIWIWILSIKKYFDGIRNEYFSTMLKLSVNSSKITFRNQTFHFQRNKLLIEIKIFDFAAEGSKEKSVTLLANWMNFNMQVCKILSGVILKIKLFFFEIKYFFC